MKAKTMITKKYSYGADAPSLHADLVHEQMRKAHQYRNALVDLERKRRDKVEATLKELFPDLCQIEAAISEKEQEIEAIRTAIKERNKGAKRRTGTEHERAAIKRLAVELRELRLNRKSGRLAVFGKRKPKQNDSDAVAWEIEPAPTWLSRNDEIEAEHTVAAKQLRAECGVFWGTYLTVEQSMQGCRSGAPPKFKRWTGDSKIAVQIQGGMTAEELLSNQDKRLRVEMSDERRGVGYLRIGSDENRAPIWTAIPFTLHRPLPEGARIKWASLVALRIGTHYEYRLQFDVTYPETEKPDTAKSGVVGIDVGWRLVPGGLRVAYWAGDDGKEGELIIPTERLVRWAKCDELKSIRDLHFNRIRSTLAAWLKDHEAPEWLTEMTKTLSHWRSPAQLAGLVLRWRDSRFAADAEPVPNAVNLVTHLRLDPKHYGTPEGMFDLLEAWRRKDKHLYDWSESQRTNNARWRDDTYRCFANHIRKQYRTVKVENTNWAVMARKAKAEDEEQYGAKEYRLVASVGRLLQILQETVPVVKKVSGVRTTMLCHACRKPTGQVNKANLIHKCEACGAEFDQDRNAALNILASADVMQESQGALAGVEPENLNVENATAESTSEHMETVALAN